MAKHMSVYGLKELIGHEGIVLTRYRDSVDVWTLGVGHTRAAGPPDPRTFTGKLTIPEAIALFKKDVKDYEDDVAAVLEVSVSATEFDALVSFHFNTGGIRQASLVKSLNGGDRERAADEFMNWSKPKEVIPRRLKEQKLFAEGRYSNGRKATIYPATKEGRVRWGEGVLHDL